MKNDKKIRKGEPKLSIGRDYKGTLNGIDKMSKVFGHIEIDGDKHKRNKDKKKNKSNFFN